MTHPLYLPDEPLYTFEGTEGRVRIRQVQFIRMDGGRAIVRTGDDKTGHVHPRVLFRTEMGLKFYVALTNEGMT